LSRNRSKLTARTWASEERVQIVEGDASDEALLVEAMSGCVVAYYLVHSMDTKAAEYRKKDLEMAEVFGRAAKAAGVSRIIYLGGLGEMGDGLSEHLSSRREVEHALAQSGVPVTVLRAAMIIGSGSASFEILRYLVERLPIMITPRWVSTESQPIAIRDVLFYLIAVLESPDTNGRTLDIGGPDVWSYDKIMHEMAKALQLQRRLVIPVPVLTPRLSSLWIHLITPLDKSIARPLAEGLRNRVVCRNNEVQELMPHKCLSIREAMDAAITRVELNDVETSWSDAGVIAGDPDWAGGTVFVDRRTISIEADPDSVWQAVCTLGGDSGYFGFDWLWRLRGRIDRVVGGPGLRRGRRNSSSLQYGDALDFWRVTGISPVEWLELTAEMKLPGNATLSFQINKHSAVDGRTELEMIARFRPRGLFGIAYWYSVLPLHGFVFRGMLQGISRAAIRKSE
tara:strand:+ start:549692 stop:551053 length:1362 start_codon:yes stop_codon:yes gene_type:complete